jgi:hypothetical protein
MCGCVAVVVQRFFDRALNQLVAALLLLTFLLLEVIQLAVCLSLLLLYPMTLLLAGVLLWLSWCALAAVITQLQMLQPAVLQQQLW